MTYTKITISGKICTGKSTLLTFLKENLKWPTYQAGQYFRDYVKKHNLVLENAEEQNETLTKKIDYEIRDMLQTKKGNLIFDSWMAGLMADHYPHVLRILLTCEDKERAARFAKREKTTIKKALFAIKSREKNLFEKLEKIHKRNDFVDPKNYNCIINTTNITCVEVANKILTKLHP